jgi:predicted NAD/FAD-dependent oxidoreductase
MPRHNAVPEIASPPIVDVVIVGAGMAGLTAARDLGSNGLDVVLLDKGRAVGGRMASRRIGDARFDHGAQHFSARSDQFRVAVAAWKESGVVAEWYTSRSITHPERGAEPRHVGVDGMRRVPEHLAAGLNVRTSNQVDRVVVDGRHVVATHQAGAVRARAAIVTAPAPQLLEIVDRSAISSLADQMAAVDYDPCLAVMAQLDGPSGLTDGHRAFPRGSIAWMADNQHKGVSPVPAITIHSTPQFAGEHLESDGDAWVAALVAAATPHVEADVVTAVGHRWRYSQPRLTFDTGSVVLDGGAPIVLAGEVFAGARVEGAFLSGTAAAVAVAERLIS